MSNEVLLQATVQGLQMGAIYALIASSMTLVFSVGGLSDLADGHFMALAMYGAPAGAAVRSIFYAYANDTDHVRDFPCAGVLLFRRLGATGSAAGALAGA